MHTGEHARTNVDNLKVIIIIVKYYIHIKRYTKTLHNIRVTIINKNKEKVTLKIRIFY